MKNYFNLLVFLLVIIISNDILSQGSVGIGTTNPDNSAILDAESTTKGMLIPRMDSLQRVSIVAPATGLMVYETNTKAIWMWNGSIWENATRPDAIYSEDLGTYVKVYNSGLISMYSENDAAILVKKNLNGDYSIDIGGGSKNIYIGSESGEQATTGNDNTGIGYNTFYLTQKGFHNTAIGSNALFSNDGNYNTAIGSYSLDRNKKGWRNTAIGNNAMQFLDSTDYNIAIGADALRFHMNGENNIAIGFEAANRDTLGIDNISIGRSSAYQNKGNRIIAIGKNVLRNNQSDDNLAIGNESMKNNSSGSGNIAVGYYSMNQNTTGTNNLAIGESALENNVSGSNNMAIGKNAGQNETGSDKLYIENSNSSTPLIWGDFANDTVKIYGTLGVGDEYSFPPNDGNSGQLLRTNGSGQLAWGDNVTTVLQDNDGDTKIQVEESVDENIIRFDLSGTEEFTMVKNNFGQGVINFTNLGGNVIVGSTPDLLNPTLPGSNDGKRNSLFGWIAGRDLTSGYDNSILGHGAGLLLTSGYYNSLIGSGAGEKLNAGDANVMVGAYSGYNTTSGTGNVFLGNSSARDEVNPSNKLFIENSNSSIPLIWGDFLNDSIKIYGSLSIKNEYTFPIVDGTNEQIMKTDGNGNITWQDDASSMELNDLSDAKSVYAQNNLFGGLGSGGSILPAGENNTAWGKNALNATTIGNDNTAVGQQALFSNLAGEWNTAVGTKALQNSNSDSNTAIGQEVLKANVSGFENTGVGAKALRSNVNGNRNTAVGEQSMENNENGSNNIAFGINALKSNIGGNENVAVGSFALYLNDYSSDNVAVGDSAMYNTGFNVSLATDNVAVGASAMQSNITGEQNTAIGSRALFSNVNGDNNTAIGSNALINNAGFRNTVVGVNAMGSSTTASFNAAFGNDALKLNNSALNAAFGIEALKNATSESNSSFGALSSINLTTGKFNTVMGSHAMYNNKIGSSNVVIGHLAFAVDTSGANNTAVGKEALGSSFAASNNTAVGYQAGFTTQGGGNVFLGHQAGYFETTGHNLYISNDSSSIPLIYGDFISNEVYFKDKVGIGLDKSNLEFTHDLTIISDDSLTLRLIGPNSSFGYGARLNFGDAHRVFIEEPTDDNMQIHADRVGVSRIPTGNKFEVEGDASKTTAGDWMANSDRRIKTNIAEIQNSFDLMKNLRPVTFNYTEEWKELHPSIGDKKYYNFIAQEYGTVFPESIQGSGEYLPGDDKEILQIDTYDAQIVTIQAVKDLIKENENLKAEVDELKASLHTLSAKVSVLISNTSIANSND